jgi:hypothetical protein
MLEVVALLALFITAVCEVVALPALLSPPILPTCPCTTLPSGALHPRNSITPSSCDLLNSISTSYTRGVVVDDDDDDDDDDDEGGKRDQGAPNTYREADVKGGRNQVAFNMPLSRATSLKDSGASTLFDVANAGAACRPATVGELHLSNSITTSSPSSSSSDMRQLLTLDRSSRSSWATGAISTGGLLCSADVLHSRAPIIPCLFFSCAAIKESLLWAPELPSRWLCARGSCWHCTAGALHLSKPISCCAAVKESLLPAPELLPRSRSRSRSSILLTGGRPTGELTLTNPITSSSTTTSSESEWASVGQMKSPSASDWVSMRMERVGAEQVAG